MSALGPRGFTLIEVLVALAILAVALAAAVRSTGVAADSTRQLKERLVATWVAQNRLAEYAVRPLFPDAGARQGTTEAGRHAFAAGDGEPDAESSLPARGGAVFPERQTTPSRRWSATWWSD
jgi:type II secretion system protein I